MGDRVADELRALGLTAKEIALKVEWATGHPIGVKTIQNAMIGSLSLDTYDHLVGAFGWDFADNVTTPRIGATREASLEQEIAHERAEIAAREARLDRLRAARRARGSVAGGELRLVSTEDRTFSP
jgi:hypothetical protein